jgi:dTDP-4-dehydrorhamnose 3,5-epimerase
MEGATEMPFQFTRLAIPDVLLVEPQVIGDTRGWFAETYKASEFARAGVTLPFTQDNHSRSDHGVLRGLHYQKRSRAQGKLIRVVVGEVFDVAVDIRRSSATFGQWVSATLSGANHRMVYVPPGFAHGFCVLSDAAEICYKTTAEYAPDFERGVAWNDPELKIPWPVAHPVVSSRDAGLPLLRNADNDF